jgi:hypothetical protein
MPTHGVHTSCATVGEKIFIVDSAWIQMYTYAVASKQYAAVDIVLPASVYKNLFCVLDSVYLVLANETRVLNQDAQLRETINSGNGNGYQNIQWIVVDEKAYCLKFAGSGEVFEFDTKLKTHTEILKLGK